MKNILNKIGLAILFVVFVILVLAAVAWKVATAVIIIGAAVALYYVVHYKMVQKRKPRWK